MKKREWYDVDTSSSPGTYRRLVDHDEASYGKVCNNTGFSIGKWCTWDLRRLRLYTIVYYDLFGKSIRSEFYNRGTGALYCIIINHPESNTIVHEYYDIDGTMVKCEYNERISGKIIDSIIFSPDTIRYVHYENGYMRYEQIITSLYTITRFESRYFDVRTPDGRLIYKGAYTFDYTDYYYCATTFVAYLQDGRKKSYVPDLEFARFIFDPVQLCIYFEQRNLPLRGNLPSIESYGA